LEDDEVGPLVGDFVVLDSVDELGFVVGDFVPEAELDDVGALAVGDDVV
jgi:hypothetical protein